MSDFADRARAEAERRWPGPNIVMPSGWHEKGMVSGFVLGALWAAEQEPSDAEVETGDPIRSDPTGD